MFRLETKINRKTKRTRIRNGHIVDSLREHTSIITSFRTCSWCVLHQIGLVAGNDC